MLRGKGTVIEFRALAGRPRYRNARHFAVKRGGIVGGRRYIYISVKKRQKSDIG